jgi:hypothetical protein
MPAEAAVADPPPPAVAEPFDIDALSCRLPLLPYQRAGVRRLVAERPVLLAGEISPTLSTEWAPRRCAGSTFRRCRVRSASTLP